MDVPVPLPRNRKPRIGASRSRTSTTRRSLRSTSRSSVRSLLCRHPQEQARAQRGGAEESDRHGQKQELQPPLNRHSARERPAPHESTPLLIQETIRKPTKE